MNFGGFKTIFSLVFAFSISSCEKRDFFPKPLVKARMGNIASFLIAENPPLEKDEFLTDDSGFVKAFSRSYDDPDRATIRDMTLSEEGKPYRVKVSYRDGRIYIVDVVESGSPRWNPGKLIKLVMERDADGQVRLDWNELPET